MSFRTVSVRPVIDYAKSSVEVAQYQLKIPNGDLLLARDYLVRVAASNSEEVGVASELLKTVNQALHERDVKEVEGAAGHVEAQISDGQGDAKT